MEGKLTATIFMLYSLVKGNHINLKLVHLTERLLNDYLNLVMKGQVRMPELGIGSKSMMLRSTQFLMTEDS
jgi:hypothetical protein